MRKYLVAGCNFESVCIPCSRDLALMIKRGFKKIGDQLKIQLNHNMMERELCFVGDDELRQSLGVQSFRVAPCSGGVMLWLGKQCVPL